MSTLTVTATLLNLVSLKNKQHIYLPYIQYETNFNIMFMKKLTSCVGIRQSNWEWVKCGHILWKGIVVLSTFIVA